MSTELDHNRIINLTAEGDKATSFSAGVYQGGMSAVVFSNKQLVTKFALPLSCVVMVIEKLTNLLTAAPGGPKVNIIFNVYNNDLKKAEPKGNLVLGKDDKGLIYFGVQAPNHPPMKFIPKTPMSFDLSEPMSDIEKNHLMIRTIIKQLDLCFPVASMLTSFKRDPMRSGGSYGAGRSTSNNENIF